MPLFKPKPKPKAEPKPYTGPSLMECCDTMDKKSKHIDVRIADCEKDIKAYMQNRTPAAKSRAISAMKRKKMLEQQRNMMQSQQVAVEHTALAQENLTMQVETVQAMEQASKTMQSQMKALDIDKFAENQDDIYDTMAEIEEVNDLFTRNYELNGMDDADIDAEFAALEEEFAMEASSAMLPGNAEQATPSYLPNSVQPAVQAEQASSSAQPSAPQMNNDSIDIDAIMNAPVAGGQGTAYPAMG